MNIANTTLPSHILFELTSVIEYQSGKKASDKIYIEREKGRKTGTNIVQVYFFKAMSSKRVRGVRL